MAVPRNKAVSKRSQAADPSQIRHVALVVEASVAPRRKMLSGVARYIQEHEPWSIYLKPLVVRNSLASWLQHWDGDGIIAAMHAPVASPITKRRLPVVDVVGIRHYEGVPLVRTNDHAVGKLGAEHLLERGYRNFGFCKYTDAFWSHRRCEGFIATLKSHGRDCEIYEMRQPDADWSGPENWEQQQQALPSWLAGLPKPVGVMTTNDMMGQQILEGCQRARAKVPEEIAVIGADDDEPVCRIACPPMSSVIINDELRGYEAAALLDRMMKGETPPREPVYIEPTGVRSRASTDALAIDDVEVLKALRFLRENVASRCGVDDVVSKVLISRSVLERRFRKLLGRSINEEIIRLRINRAIELLTQTGLELKVIAERTGFGAQSYMNSVFMNRLNRTPKSFRRAAQPIEA